LVLVLVDPDAPDVRLVGRLQRALPAAAGDLELDLRTLRDLVRRDRLALVGLGEALRVVDEDLRSRNRLLRAELVARDPDCDRRNRQAADGADRVAAHLLGLPRGEDADETPGLVGRVVEPHHVRVRLLEYVARVALRALGAVVSDRELR